MRPVQKPGFIKNFIVLALLAVLTLVCAFHEPLSPVWVGAAVVSAVTGVVWFARWGLRLFLWIAAAMFGLDEESQKAKR
jgi:hypothetical protein